MDRLARLHGGELEWWSFQVEVWGYATNAHNDIAYLCEKGDRPGWWDHDRGWLDRIFVTLGSRRWRQAPVWYALPGVVTYTLRGLDAWASS